MTALLSWVLLAALVTHACAHVGIAVGLGAEGAWRRAAAAFVVAPLAPWWGWHAGMRRRVIAWAASLAVYAIGVALA